MVGCRLRMFHTATGRESVLVTQATRRRMRADTRVATRMVAKQRRANETMNTSLWIHFPCSFVSWPSAGRHIAHARQSHQSPRNHTAHSRRTSASISAIFSKVVMVAVGSFLLSLGFWMCGPAHPRRCVPGSVRLAEAVALVCHTP
jgi:hypothetical protein